MCIFFACNSIRAWHHGQHDNVDTEYGYENSHYTNIELIAGLANILNYFKSFKLLYMNILYGKRYFVDIFFRKYLFYCLLFTLLAVVQSENQIRMNDIRVCHLY